MAHSCRLEGEEQRVENQPEKQGRRLVSLLLSTRQDDLSRPAIRQVCLIVRPRVEALEQINVRYIQLLQPPPQGRVVWRVERILEVQVAAEEGLPPLCRVLDCPVQALHLPLRGVQPTEPLLRGVQQSVSLC